MIQPLDISNIDPQVIVTSIQVSALPEDHPDARTWSVSVEYRGKDSYAVVHHGQNLSQDGQWNYEPSNSSRDDHFIAQHRFSYEEAIDLAKEACKTIVINSMTAADVLTLSTLSDDEASEYRRGLREVRVREWFAKTFAPMPASNDLSDKAKDTISDIIVEIVANLYKDRLVNVDDVKREVKSITGWEGLAVNEALVYGIKEGKFMVDRELFLVSTTAEAYDEVQLKTKR